MCEKTFLTFDTVEKGKNWENISEWNWNVDYERRMESRAHENGSEIEREILWENAV